MAFRIARWASWLRGRPGPRAGASDAELMPGTSSAATARFSARSRSRPGSTRSATSAPASATPAATSRVVLIADVYALSATWLRVAPAWPPMRSATAPAPPIEPSAAARAGSGRSLTAPSMSAPYWPDRRLPRIATPRVPPTMRTVSFMAEPTPA